jgi:tRNA(adenine34) deaminase
MLVSQAMVSARKKRSTSKKRWIAGVRTDSTHPPKGLFTKDASTIARILASKRVSPKGRASGMRMLNYFINRAGHNLSPSRRKTLERAKALLWKRIHASAPKHARPRTLN